jgi:hypothetical protein
VTRALVPRQELAAGLRALAEERVPDHEVGYKKDHHAGTDMIAMVDVDRAAAHLHTRPGPPGALKRPECSPQ